MKKKHLESMITGLKRKAKFKNGQLIIEFVTDDQINEQTKDEMNNEITGRFNELFGDDAFEKMLKKEVAGGFADYQVKRFSKHVNPVLEGVF